MNIPFVDLQAQYQSLKPSIDRAIAECIETTSFIGGPQVKAFEQAFAAFAQRRYCIGCGNGTDALEILLQAMGVGPGDEVLVPAISWISTAEVVTTVGATPVFVDIEADFYTLDPSKLEAKINERSKAIIPVHLYGQAANMPRIMEIAQKYDLLVLEDCAQAHGAQLGGKQIGTFGHAASFSFYPGKNLGAYGDAGGMVTDDENIASVARMIANHGQTTKHHHELEGRNSRLDGLQATVLQVKLPHLSGWNEARRNKAALYDTALAGIEEITTPSVRSESRPVFHLYVIRTAQRDALADFLEKQGISTSIHYPTAMPFMPCYQKRFAHKPSDFPVAHKAQGEILSLPIFPELTEEQINYVAMQIRAFFNQ